MLDTLVQFVFYLITSVYSLLFSPFISLIFNLFPDLTNIITHITSFITTACTYLIFCIDLLCIPRSALVLLFNYYAIKYSIYIIQNTIKLGVKIYHTFKP